MAFGTVNYEAQTDANGDQQIWLDRSVLAKLNALHWPSESYSDLIL
jgi:hypothetical protein